MSLTPAECVAERALIDQLLSNEKVQKAVHKAFWTIEEKIVQEEEMEWTEEDEPSQSDEDEKPLPKRHCVR